jgi:hypothetical protein
MLTTQAIAHFQGDKAAMAKLLKIAVQSIYGWGPIVPYYRQLQLEKLTGGKLKAMTLKRYIATRKPPQKATA